MRLRALVVFLSFLPLGVQADDPLDRAYRQAVIEAAFPTPASVTDKLVPIRKDNPQLVWSADGAKVLVATWKSRSGYEKFLKPATQTSDNPDYAIWVTAAPQLQRFCAQIPKDGLDLRLKQYLGLDRSWSYDVVVEMWVDPADLIRPCADPEATDATCDLQPAAPAASAKGIPDYRGFLARLYYKSYREKPASSAGVPWTGLGYTYDWGGPDKVGASEYILAPASKYEIKGVTETAAYCASR